MLELPKELMDPEDALKILVAALKVSLTPGLDKVEVQRLTAIAALARTYNSLWKDYERIKEVEKKIVEINQRIEALEMISGENAPEASNAQTVKNTKSLNSVP
jgi:hypothetical protein